MMVVFAIQIPDSVYQGLELPHMAWLLVLCPHVDSGHATVSGPTSILLPVYSCRYETQDSHYIYSLSEGEIEVLD